MSRRSHARDLVTTSRRTKDSAVSPVRPVSRSAANESATIGVATASSRTRNLASLTSDRYCSRRSWSYPSVTIAASAVPAADQVDGYAQHDQGGDGSADHPRLGALKVLPGPVQGTAGHVGRADPVGQLIDGASEVLAGPLDLGDQRIRVADCDLTVRLGHHVHPFWGGSCPVSVAGGAVMCTAGTVTGQKANGQATQSGLGAGGPAPSGP